MSDSTTSEATGPSAVGPQLPEFVEWIAAAVIALAGMALVVGGSVLTAVIDRAQIADSVEAGEITVVIIERELTQAETLEFILEVITWTGWGLLVTGVGLILFAIGYVFVRHRAYQRTPDDESTGSFRSSAVLGAVTTGVLSFLPVSPAIGGGVAGYLEEFGTGRTVSVGALSGFLAVIPLLVILVFVTIGIYIGLATIQHSGLGIVATAAMLFALFVTGGLGAGLGALGGFIGGRIAD